ncbi:methyltransferase domain-containing protein [Haliangium sp.]|uniref:SAM-dependent methyltransferase n=1 Tax=Haliangium sp. TaxID=2663208 RepID=UPI003D140A55
MDWRIKGTIQKLLSVVPGGVRANDLLQRTVGQLRHFEVNVGSKVYDWSIHVDHLNSLELSIEGKRVFEIGTGWFPTLPVCFWLVGAGSCLTYDLNRHLDQSLSFRMVRALGGQLDRIADTVNLDRAVVAERHRELLRARDLDELLARAHIEYHAPADATTSGLPDGSVDIIFSNSVLEHVPPAVLDALMRESYRILRPGGLVVHSVNCGDHYAYFDKRINFMNYLQYSEAEWQRWNNDLQYQNRLRPQDFVDVTIEAGFDMLICMREPKPDLLAALPSTRIAPEFAHYPPEELAAKSVDIVATKPVPTHADGGHAG